MKQYEFVIDDKDKSGVFAISLVDRPAIETLFIKLSEEDKNDVNEFEDIKEVPIYFADEDKRVVVGPALIPNQPIYRKDVGGEEAFVYFSEKTISHISSKFLKNNFNNEITLNHDMKTDKVHLLESWIIESDKYDKSKMYGYELPVGTWMLMYKVEDESIWNDVKSNKFNGFSIEGNFKYIDKKPVKESKEYVKKNQTNMKEDDIFISNKECDEILLEINKIISKLI